MPIHTCFIFSSLFWILIELGLVPQRLTLMFFVMLSHVRVCMCQVGALSLAQRQLLYAHDELGMAVMRLQLGPGTGEDGEGGEGHHPQSAAAADLATLHPSELPVKNTVCLYV